MYIQFKQDGSVSFGNSEDAIGEYSELGPFFIISNPDNTDVSIKGIALLNWIHLEGSLQDNPLV